MCRVLNKRTHGVPRGAVYIGRPSIWGNPFEIGKHGDREQVIELYRQWFFAEGQDGLRERAVRDLAGKDLVCWCAPQACHGDVLREYVS